MPIKDRIGNPITLLGAVEVEDGGLYAVHYVSEGQPQDDPKLGESPYLRAGGGLSEIMETCARVASETDHAREAAIRRDFSAMLARIESGEKD